MKALYALIHSSKNFWNVDDYHTDYTCISALSVANFLAWFTIRQKNWISRIETLSIGLRFIFRTIVYNDRENSWQLFLFSRYVCVCVCVCVCVFVCVCVCVAIRTRKRIRDRGRKRKWTNVYKWFIANSWPQRNALSGFVLHRCTISLCSHYYYYYSMSLIYSAKFLTLSYYMIENFCALSACYAWERLFRSFYYHRIWMSRQVLRHLGIF